MLEVIPQVVSDAKEVVLMAELPLAAARLPSRARRRNCWDSGMVIGEEGVYDLEGEGK